MLALHVSCLGQWPGPLDIYTEADTVQLTVRRGRVLERERERASPRPGSVRSAAS